MKKVAILHVLILLLVQLHFVSFDSGVKILSDPTDVQQRTQNSCDPFFYSTLNGESFTPEEPVVLELDLSCFEYQLIHDIDPDGKMDFDLQVRLFEANSGNSEQIWFANQNSKNGVGFNSVLWDFNQGSTSFTEVFYLNGPINNGAENDNELWPLAANNLTPYTNYTVQVSLISLNQTYDHTMYHSFSIVPSSDSQPCTPFLKVYATDSEVPDESNFSSTYNFTYFNEIVHNHLYLGCVDPLESYQVTWAISFYQSGHEVEVGWWNVTGVEYANTTISRSAESIHVFDGLMIYSISGFVSSSANETIEYYPSFDRGYSYDGFNIDITDSDDDGIEDLIDNCQTEPNSEQSDLDSNGVGDVCDTDIDGDNLSNSIPPNQMDDDDKCPYEFTSTSQDLDGDGCIDPDQDGDGILDANDNCILVPNPNQANLDDDAQGDACDGDIDGDNVTNVAPIHYTNGTSQDLCPYVDATDKDENQDGCIDEIVMTECPICGDENLESDSSSTIANDAKKLDDNLIQVAVFGGTGLIVGIIAGVSWAWPRGKKIIDDLSDDFLDGLKD